MLNGKIQLASSQYLLFKAFPISSISNLSNFNQSIGQNLRQNGSQIFIPNCWHFIHLKNRFFCICRNTFIGEMAREKKVSNSLKPLKYSAGLINKNRNQKNLSTTKVKNGNRMNIVLQKKHGQHLLKNPGVLEKIIIASKIKRTDTVLEVGCGTGNLTVKLLPLSKKVITIDIDPRMINEVKKRCLYEGYNNLEVYEGDAIKTVFPPFDVFTANIPYKISSPLVFKLITHRPKFRCAVLMFQKEFADRMLANPGDKNYSRLSINVKMFFKVSKVCNVDRGSFNPPPKVDSIVLKLIPKNLDTRINFEELDNLLRVCFSRKRKTLHAIFKRQAVLNMLEHNYKNFCTLNNKVPTDEHFKTFCLQVLTDLDYNELRSVNMDITDFLALLLEFNKRGIHFCNVFDNKSNAFGAQWEDVIVEEEEEEEGEKEKEKDNQ